MPAEVSNQVEEEQPEATTKKTRPLEPHRLSFEDHMFVRHCLIVPQDLDPKLLTESTLYLSVAHRLHPLDHITCIWENRSAIAEVIVMEASQSFTSLVLLNYRKLPGILSDGSEALVNFEVFYSQIDGYCVRRLSDSVLLVSGATSKEHAIEQLKAHAAFKAD